VTRCPQKALSFHHRSAGGEVTIVAALAAAARGTYALWARWAVQLAWAGQRLGHGPGKLGLAQGAPVAVGCTAARANSCLSLFLFNLFQNSIQI
jgi:hypothetical protein